MEKYASKAIKSIIAEFPGIEKILEEYGIGCGPCTVGICQLKDILEIHTLPVEAEEALMRRIEAEIYPERNIAVPAGSALQQPPSARTGYSRPMQVLVDEHKLIKRWLALIPALAEKLDLNSVEDCRTAENGIDLIRSYADRLHHGKEEDILFAYFDNTADIFQVIYEDHRRGRAFVQEMLRALETKNSKVLAANLLEYAALLKEHIHKEDEVLFPWLDSRLSEGEKAEIAARFDRSDSKLGLDDRKYHSFIERLERQIR